MSRYSTPRASHTKEENRTDLEDQPLLENIKCEYHPTFKIDAISTNDKRSNLKLHCIKCIIDCKDFQASDGDRMITIKELIQKSTEPQISNIDKIAKRREALQNTFLDFLTKNYAPLYEQHAEAQFKAVDSEIGDLIEKLNKLRVRYRAYFASKADDINSKVLEIKQNIARFLEDEPILDPSPIFTPSEIHDKMTKISHKDDLLEFLSSIHKKTREPVDIQSTEDSKTLELMNEVKNTYNQSISFCVDMSKLKGNFSPTPNL